MRDVPLPSGGVLALVTLDNGRDHTRPSTLGPQDAARARPRPRRRRRPAPPRGEIRAVAVTGKPFILAAGADLSKVGDIPSREAGVAMAQLGH